MIASKHFVTTLGINYLDYAAAYYPWVNTTIVQESELSYENFDSKSLKVLQTCLKSELHLPDKKND